ncbi:caveolae-associated protein 2 isoform X2 [Pteropus alecto]|uniref:caveolae-associated protein 2 isoform X2 n=1 Tax=Pteropus alecto TaxID=9402 RepID=UPI0007689179|nr:caveolae-associated protein 2 isoform X2 [Pteropus alecto]
MGEDAAQAEKFQQPGSGLRQERPASPSPVPSSTPSPSLNLGSTDEAIRDNSQVNAVTVLTLLDKLVNMLDAVQDNQHKMEQRQISLEGSVKGIQNDLTKLSKYQASTSNTDENEIPASVFVKEPASKPVEGKDDLADENKSLEETLHTVDLSSEDELPHDEEALEDSAEEKMEESRAEKIKRSSLQKVDSLKKAFSRQNIEKKMNKLGTKIVSAERREKIKKSLASSHQKISSGKSSPFKVSPLTFGRKKVREGESTTENETKSEDMPSNDQMLNDHEESSFAEGHSEASLTSDLVEGKGAEGDAGRAASRGSNSGMDSNVDLAIVEDEGEESVALEQAQKVRYEGGYVLASEDAEQSDEEPVKPAVLQVDQTA